MLSSLLAAPGRWRSGAVARSAAVVAGRSGAAAAGAARAGPGAGAGWAVGGAGSGRWVTVPPRLKSRNCSGPTRRSRPVRVPAWARASWCWRPARARFVPGAAAPFSTAPPPARSSTAYVRGLSPFPALDLLSVTARPRPRRRAFARVMARRARHIKPTCDLSRVDQHHFRVGFGLDREPRPRR